MVHWKKIISGIAGIIVLISVIHAGISSPVTKKSGTPSFSENLVVADTQNNTLSLITEPNAGITPILNAIQNAKTSVDLVMYQLEDTAVEQALADDTSRGVTVRVILNGGYYGKPDTPNVNLNAYNFLTTHGVLVEWSPALFALTHQKSLVVDNSIAYIMTFNMTPQYYVSSRDFAVVDTDTADVSAIGQTFTTDWSDKNIAQNASAEITGDDLIWSPGSEDSLIALIQNAHKSLLVYNEEMNDPDIVRVLSDAAQRGVNVEVVMTDSTEWHVNFDTLSAVGVVVKTYDPKASLYIHAKVIVADDATAFIGSENFSPTSFDDNRELGIITSQPDIVTSLEQTFASDFKNATVYK